VLIRSGEEAQGILAVGLVWGSHSDRVGAPLSLHMSLRG
jgi:hypothetical protein